LWQDRAARLLLVSSLALSLALLAWVSLVIPSHPSLALGFLPTGGPEDSGPGARLLLLPVLNGLSFLIDLVWGLYFYRRPDKKILAYLLWTTSTLTSILFLVAVELIIHTG